MGIQPETIKSTLDFKYTHEDPTGSSSETYFIRFHHVNSQPILSISDDGKDYYSFPAVMFIEVADFLKRQGAVPNTSGQNVANTTLPLRSNRLPESDTSPSGMPPLPIPSSGGTIGLDSNMGPVNDNPPLQSFAGLGGLVSRISSAGPSSEEEQQMLARPVIRGDVSSVSVLGKSEKAIKSNHQ